MCVVHDRKAKKQPEVKGLDQGRSLKKISPKMWAPTERN